LSKIIDDFARKNSAVGLAVGVVYPGKTKSSPAVTQTFFWGETRRGNNQLPDEKTLFGIGSVGKIFTTTLLADMVFNQKLLALNDLVQPYYDKYAPGVVTLPTFKGKGIRFVHLATHTAGLPDQPKAIKGNECGAPLVDVYDFINHYKLTQAPGDVASYSDLGFDLLADILNRILGSQSRDQSLKDMLSRAKLDMPDTGGITLDLQKNPRYATGYIVKDNGKVVKADPMTCDPGNQHVGQVASTLKNMVQWALFNLGLTDSPFNNLLPELQKGRYPWGNKNDQIGLGWKLAPLKKGSDQYTFTKDGSSQLGYSADMLFTPLLGTASVVLANVNAIGVPGLNADLLDALNQS
jgi:D-alanyl-D-alanine-carboxypeptidase/D-alanyl-D-alanine-endopeptidase